MKIAIQRRNEVKRKPKPPKVKPYSIADLKSWLQLLAVDMSVRIPEIDYAGPPKRLVAALNMAGPHKYGTRAHEGVRTITRIE